MDNMYLLIYDLNSNACLICSLQKVSLWKKIHVIYSFFFVRKVVAHINTFVFYCIVLPATVLVPEVVVPKWGSVYIPSIITLLNAVGTPRSYMIISSFLLFYLPLQSNLILAGYINEHYQM